MTEIMKKMDLLDAVEMSPDTLAKLGRNEDVSMDVLRRICGYLECDIGDIMEMIPNDIQDKYKAGELILGDSKQVCGQRSERDTAFFE